MKILVARDVWKVVESIVKIRARMKVVVTRRIIVVFEAVTYEHQVVV